MKFYVTQGMVNDKVYEIISLRQSKWLEIYINFNTQKGKKAKNKFEKDLIELLINGFFGKMLENVRRRLKIEFIKNCEIDKIIKQ